eukprot:889166_1
MTENSSNQQNEFGKKEAQCHTSKTELLDENARKALKNGENALGAGQMNGAIASESRCESPIEHRCSLSLLYVPGGMMPSVASLVGKLIEIRIAAKYLTCRNKDVIKCQVWGDEVYTDDSDAVAILRHAGMVYLRSAPPAFPGVSAYFKILPARQCYPSSCHYRYRSRRWGSKYDNFSLEVVDVEPITDSALLEPERSGVIPMNRRNMPKYRSGGNKTKYKAHKDLTFMFNLENEPCMKYDVDLIADRHLHPNQWLSAKIRKEVLILENHKERFELSVSRDIGDGLKYPLYRWARVKMGTYGVKQRSPCPLPASHSLLDLIHDDLSWAELVWDSNSVVVRGTKYPLEKMVFRACDQPVVQPQIDSQLPPPPAPEQPKPMDTSA